MLGLRELLGPAERLVQTQGDSSCSRLVDDPERGSSSNLSNHMVVLSLTMRIIMVIS